MSTWCGNTWSGGWGRMLGSSNVEGWRGGTLIYSEFAGVTRCPSLHWATIYYPVHSRLEVMSRPSCHHVTSNRRAKSLWLTLYNDNNPNVNRCANRIQFHIRQKAISERETQPEGRKQRYRTIRQSPPLPSISPITDVHHICVFNGQCMYLRMHTVTLPLELL
eukprot:4448189-Amphidinium_carterae.1